MRLSAVLLFVAAAAWGGDRLVVATDATWPPMEYEYEGRLVGFDVELMSAVARHAGYDVEFRNVSWDGIFAGLQRRDYDVIASSVTITAERKRLYGFTEPYIDAGQALVVRSDSNLAQLTDLRGRKVAAQLGTTGEEAVRQVLGSQGLVSVDDIEEGVGMLRRGDVDGLVVDLTLAVVYTWQSLELQVVGDLLTSETYGFVTRKTDVVTLTRLNDALRELKASGELAALHQVWFAGRDPALK